LSGDYSNPVSLKDRVIFISIALFLFVVVLFGSVIVGNIEAELVNHPDINKTWGIVAKG